MIRTSYRAIVLLVLAFSVPACAEDEALPLSQGLYEVVVTLDLPHLDGMGASRTTKVCISPSGEPPTHGLAVLSENNPLATCPASKGRLDASTYRFEVHCAGKNAAEGFATFDLYTDRFQGSIVMKMGGKNMTMSETQSGRRIGECPKPPHS